MEIKQAMGKSPKKDKYRGNLNIDSAEIPGASKWDIGQEIEMTVKVRVTGLREPDKWEISEGSAKKGQVNVNSEIISFKENATK